MAERELEMNFINYKLWTRELAEYTRPEHEFQKNNVDFVNGSLLSAGEQIVQGSAWLNCDQHRRSTQEYEGNWCDKKAQTDRGWWLFWNWWFGWTCWQFKLQCPTGAGLRIPCHRTNFPVTCTAPRVGRYSHLHYPTTVPHELFKPQAAGLSTAVSLDEYFVTFGVRSAFAQYYDCHATSLALVEFRSEGGNFPPER